MRRMLASLDPHVRRDVVEDWRRSRRAPRDPGSDSPVVLVGQRAAGKSRLLPLVAEAMGRSWFDLDLEIERRAGEPLASVFRSDPARFRELERELFKELPSASVISVGGGFWSHHADLLSGFTAVEIPITFETYRRRLIDDRRRPRIRPDLSLEEEVRQVYAEREAIHRELPCWRFGQLLAALERST